MSIELKCRATMNRGDYSLAAERHVRMHGGKDAARQRAIGMPGSMGVFRQDTGSGPIREGDCAAGAGQNGLRSMRQWGGAHSAQFQVGKGSGIFRSLALTKALDSAVFDMLRKRPNDNGLAAPAATLSGNGYGNARAALKKYELNQREMAETESAKLAS